MLVVLDRALWHTALLLVHTFIVHNSFIPTIRAGLEQGNVTM